MRTEIGDIVDVLEPFENWNQTDTTEAVRDLRRTAFSSQCRPIAGSLMGLSVSQLANRLSIASS